MYTLKHAVQLKEHYGRDIEVYVFYIDMRTNFEGYEEFYTRAREMGVNFVRGRVSKVLETPEKNLVIRAEDTLLGEPIELESEMVVLASAAVACSDAGDVSRVLNITRGTDGFFEKLRVHRGSKIRCSVQSIQKDVGGVIWQRGVGFVHTRKFDQSIGVGQAIII